MNGEETFRILMTHAQTFQPGKSANTPSVMKAGLETPVTVGLGTLDLDVVLGNQVPGSGRPP